MRTFLAAYEAAEAEGRWTSNMISFAEAARLFSYDPDTGLLTRKITVSHNAQAGAIAGTLDGKGYLHVSIRKRFYRVHRICFLLAHGWVPPEVDHADRVKTNNRFKNLRPATRRDQMGNAFWSRNTSGFRGVSLNARSGLWHAQIKIDGKQTYLGRAATPAEAARVYDAAARKHFGDFARLNFP